MPYLNLEAEASERLRRGRSEVWGRISLLPQAFDYFPLINRVHELEANHLFRLELGPFGYGSFSTHADCEVTAFLKPEEEIVFESVAGSGNADVRVALRLTGDDSHCELGARLEVAPRISIPRLVPVGLLRKTGNATLVAGLEHGMRSVKREIEAQLVG